VKILKTVSIIVFIAAVILFGGYVLKEKAGQDHTGPVISMESDHIEVSIADSRDALLAGVTAADARDGDLTAAVRVEAVGPIDEEGNRIVRYVVIDSDAHISRALRKMSYTDYTAPVINLTGPLSFPVGTVNLLQGVSAQDCIDGDISGQIQILYDEEMNPSVPGIYPARLRVTNSIGGYAELPASIEFYNTVERGGSQSSAAAAPETGTTGQEVVVTEGGAEQNAGK
jgi:hypothetical protein